MKKLLTMILIFIFTMSGVYAEANATVKVPVIMYHSVADGNSDAVISVENFQKHLEAIKENKFTPISIEQMVDFVDFGTPLPENSVCITFDDGYTDNYEKAYPLLERFGFNATIFVIGSSVGRSQYKDTQYKMNPHFDYEQAKEMMESGLISIQSHTYDMHQWPQFEMTKNPRECVLRFPGEGLVDYIRTFESDFLKIKTLIESEVGNKVIGFAYPRGRYDAISDYLLRKNGVRVTMATSMGTNYITKYDKNSLYNLHRYTMHNGVDAVQLIKWLNED